MAVALLLIINVNVFGVLAQRVEFPIKLAKLSLCIEDQSDSITGVRVSFGNPEYWWVITPTNDSYIRSQGTGRETKVYQETPTRGYQVNSIEAEILKRVFWTFTETLTDLDGLLQKGEWAKCRYLDGYMPRFLKGLFYLYSSAKCSQTLLPSYALVPDSLYNVSLSSPLSDARVAQWQSDKMRTVYLRIIIKELKYQIHVWEKADLDHVERDPDALHSAKFEEAFGIFIKLYFNATPVPPMNWPQGHL